MTTINSPQIIYPSVLFAKDGWIQIIKRNTELNTWNLGSLERYLNMGLYFLDSEDQLWKASGYELLSSPPKSKIKTAIDFLRYGILPISEVKLSYNLIEDNGLDYFKKLILNNPPKKKLVFSKSDLKLVQEMNTVSDLIKIIKRLE